MTWRLFVWLLLLILQGGLLGRCMYNLLSLSDLEQDWINPIELSKRINKFVMVELVAQVLSLAAAVLGGVWFMAAWQAGITAYLVHQHIRKQVKLDATDAFKQLKPQQRWRLILFGAYCCTFILATYRLIETVIHSVLTPEGREIAKKLFKEAAASLPGY